MEAIGVQSMTEFVWPTAMTGLRARMRDVATMAARRSEGAAPALAHASQRDSANLLLLAVDVQDVGSRVHVTATGEVDIGSVGELQKALDVARETGAQEVWLDLTRTTFIECRGLHALLDLRADLIEASRRLVLICPEGPVLRLLALAGADRDFEIHSTPPPSS